MSGSARAFLISSFNNSCIWSKISSYIFFALQWQKCFGVNFQLIYPNRIYWRALFTYKHDVHPGYSFREVFLI